MDPKSFAGLIFIIWAACLGYVHWRKKALLLNHGRLIGWLIFLSLGAVYTLNHSRYPEGVSIFDSAAWKSVRPPFYYFIKEWPNPTNWMFPILTVAFVSCALGLEIVRAVKKRRKPTSIGGG